MNIDIYTKKFIKAIKKLNGDICEQTLFFERIPNEVLNQLLNDNKSPSKIYSMIFHIMDIKTTLGVSALNEAVYEIETWTFEQKVYFFNNCRYMSKYSNVREVFDYVSNDYLFFEKENNYKIKKNAGVIFETCEKIKNNRKEDVEEIINKALFLTRECLIKYKRRFKGKESLAFHYPISEQNKREIDLFDKYLYVEDINLEYPLELRIKELMYYFSELILEKDIFDDFFEIEKKYLYSYVRTTFLKSDLPSDPLFDFRRYEDIIKTLDRYLWLN